MSGVGSAVISGLSGGAVAVALAAAAERGQGLARRGADGWRALRPSWFAHVAFVGCAAITALIAHFLLKGGSTRPDAHTQNLYALGLAIAFGFGAVYVGWTVYGRVIAWKDDELRVRTVLGRETVQPIANVGSLKKSDALGEYRIRFLDGSTLRFSAYLHGAHELAQRLLQRADED